MSGSRIRLVIAVTALSVCFLSCGRGQLPPEVSIDGSSTIFPITEAVAESFREVDPDVRVTIGISGTGGGMKRFVRGEIDICNASRAITTDERAAAKEHGIEVLELEVAFDGLTVVVHSDNDWCECLTVEQLKEIWRPESAVQKWSDVNPDWPDEEMRLYGPGADSGTFDYFTSAIVGEERASRADFTASEDDNMLASGVQVDPYALGYFGFAYYRENKDRLKLVGVDGGNGCVQPSDETVRDGTYIPLSRPLFIYVRKSALARPEVAQFVRFYLENGPELARETGYMAPPDDAIERNRKLLRETLPTTEATEGSKA